MSRGEWFQMWVAIAQVTVAAAVVSAALVVGLRSGRSRRRQSNSA